MTYTRLILLFLGLVMRISFFIFCLLCLISSNYALEPEKNPYHQPSWFKSSFLEIQEDVNEATEKNKQLILYFHQEGCPYCSRLMRDFDQPAMAKKIQSYFDVVELNIWGDRIVTEKDGSEISEKNFAKKYHIQYTPTLLFLDQKGDISYRVDGYYKPYQLMAVFDYIGKKLNKKQRFSSYYANLKKKQIQSNQNKSVLKSPDNFAKIAQTKTPLLIIFENKACQSCDEVHQIIKTKPAIKEKLKQFQVVFLDRFSKQLITTPSGLKMSVQAWANQLKIHYAPSFVFFEQDKEVFRLESWLKAFHLTSILDYVSTQTYKTQPEFQRYLQDRADKLRAQGIEVNLMD